MYSLTSRHSLSLRLTISVLIATLMLPAIAMANPTNSDIDSLRAQASSARVRLDQLAYETELASENYFEAQDLLETTLAEIARTEEKLADNQVQLDYMNGLLSERAVSTYVDGDLSFITFLFSSTSLTDFFERIGLLQVIMDNDATIIRDVRQLRSEIQISKDRLEEKREIERETAERAEAEFQNVQTSLNAQQRLLASLDSEVERLIAEERAAIEAEQIRLAEERQAAEERERAAQEAAESSQSASESSGAENSGATASTAGTSSSTGNSGSASSSGNSNNNSASAGSGSSSTGSSGSGSSSGGASSGGSGSSSGSQTPSLGRERPGVVAVARRFVGATPYLWGGTTPAGFDCSGLVQFSYREAYGINLPRTSRQQFHAGVFIPPNRSDLMRPGDLVFFSRTGRPENIHHVGIFVGNNRMIHAPSSGRLVSEQTIWRSDFIGAVRP